VFGAGREAEEPDGAGSGPVQEADGPVEEAVEDLHGQGDGQGGLFGHFQGDGLGGQFAHDDVQEGDQAEGHGEGDGVQHGRGHVPFEQRVQQVGHGGLADPAQAQGGQGDAQLGGGDVGVQVVDEAQQAHGLAAAFGGQGGDARAPDAHEGELRGHEKAVGQNQDEDQEQVCERAEHGRSLMKRAVWTAPLARVPCFP
jgi:hypothetical protein